MATAHFDQNVISLSVPYKAILNDLRAIVSKMIQVPAELINFKDLESIEDQQTGLRAIIRQKKV